MTYQVLLLRYLIALLAYYLLATRVLPQFKAINPDPTFVLISSRLRIMMLHRVTPNRDLGVCIYLRICSKRFNEHDGNKKKLHKYEEN